MLRLESKVYTSNGTFVAPAGVTHILVSSYYSELMMKPAPLGMINLGGNNIGIINSLDGSAWMWGLGTSGQLGNNKNNDIGTRSPISVVGNTSWKQLTTANVSLLSSGYTVAIRGSDGSLWSWGDNTLGLLGTNSAASSSSPVSVVGGNSYTSVVADDRHCMAIRGSDGSLWAWGDNATGELGDNTVTSRSSPVSVVGNISWASMTGTDGGSAAINAADGSAWAWGLGTSGQLGNNTITNKSSPISVSGARSYVAISAGSAFVVAINGVDGSAWSWGLGTNGALGNNTVTSISVPVSVVGANSFTAISCGFRHTLALRGSDGSAWAWGLNTSGQLGDGTIVTKSSPVSVLGNNSFVNIFAGTSGSSPTGGTTSYGLKADGSFWVWGSGVNGELGQGNESLVVGVSSPIMIAPVLSTFLSEKGRAKITLMAVTPGTSYPVNFNGLDCVNFNGYYGFGTSICIGWAE